MRWWIGLFLVWMGSLHAQYDHTPVFPELTIDQLASAVKQAYKPDLVLSLSDARDTLYKRVYQENDTVYCVYTQMGKYLDPNSDPSQYLFESGNNDDINLEHIYPRSKGADSGFASSDMHHLIPTRVPVNSARASDPFMEINDAQTNSWFYLEQTLNSKPNSNIDLYSEDTDFAFEPREAAKGNIARAMFYFYTMYTSEANNADPFYFENQLDQLCDWHYKDPVDSLEWVRTWKIAEYQGDKPNPFVLDCSLARMHCGDISQACRIVDSKEVEGDNDFDMGTVYSTGETIVFPIDNVNQRIIMAQLFEISGRKVFQTRTENHRLSVTLPLAPGLYLLVLQSAEAVVQSKTILLK